MEEINMKWLIAIGLIAGAIMMSSDGSTTYNATEYSATESTCNYEDRYDLDFNVGYNYDDTYDSECDEYSAYETDSYVAGSVYSDDYTEEPGDNSSSSVEEAWSDNHQTAPMPDALFSAADLLGNWVDDPASETPLVLNFYMENGEIKYKLYKILLGNNIGMNTANEYTAFGYAEGRVEIMANQGSVCCMTNTAEAYMCLYYGFYGKDTMVNQEGGSKFYRYNGSLNAVY